MIPRVRFAPSPTGQLHVGNLRTAIVNWLFAQATGGQFILRLDDTDQARSTEESAQSIRDDLAWLGFDIAEEHRQSARFDAYERAQERLVASGRLYPCYESAHELDLRRKVQLSRGLPPVYDRAALHLTADERAAFEAQGIQPHWRFKLDTASRIEFDDLIQGHISMDPASVSDPVVRRADGSWLYMLPSVIDDIDMGITHIVRGQDHLTNTAVQTQMFAALGAPCPTFAHLALLSMRDQALSKRLGSAGVAHYRAMGIEPISLIAYLGRLGTSDPIEPVTDAAPLVASFDWAKFNKANALFDEAELSLLNTKIIHHMSFEAVSSRLPADMMAADWDLLRGNVERIDAIARWWQVVCGEITPIVEEPEFVATAQATLAELPWTDDIWTIWTNALKDATGRKGKALFMPLRLALTGQPHGPEMGPVLTRMGRERALRRLET